MMLVPVLDSGVAMTQDKDSRSTASEGLRLRAESILKEKSSSLNDISQLSMDQIRSLVHELGVHQIELELQNEELRETQRELTQSRDAFIDLYEFAPVGYLTISLQGIIVRANLTAAKLFGVDRKLLLNKPLSGFVVPEDRDKYYLHKIHSGERTTQNTWLLRLVKGDSSVFEVEVKVAPILDSDGNVKQFRLVLSDISEISETAVRIHQSPEILRLFIDQAPVAIAMFDTDMRYLAASHRWARDFKVDDIELLGRRHYEVFSDIPDRFREHHRRGMTGETIRADEDLLERADGSSQWLRWEVKPWYRPNNTVGGIIIFSEDITNLKQSTDALNKSQQRLHLAQESARTGIWEWDTVSNEAYWSEELWSLYGLNPHSCELNYEAWFETVHPDDRDKLRDQILEAVNSKAKLNAEWRVIHPDCSVTWLMSRGAPVADKAGQLSLYRGIVIDVTDRKLMEDELHRRRQNLEPLLEERSRELLETKELLQTILDSLPVGVCYIDPKQRYLFSNHTHQMWWGKSPDKIVGRTVEEITGDTFSDIKPKLEAAMAGQNVVSELVCKYPESIKDLSVKMVPHRGSDGTLRGVVGFFTDMTEVREAQRRLFQSEATFRSLFENSVDGNILGLPDGTLLRANPTACSILGKTEDELRDSGRDGIVDRNDPRLLDHLERIKNEGRSSAEVNYVRGNGTVFPVEVTTSVFPIHDGSQMVALSFKDISERKKAEQELKDSETRLRSYFDSPLIGISITSPEKDWVEVNEMTCQMLGYSREELFGMTWEQMTHPDDLPRNLQYFERLKAGGIDSYRMEKRFIKKDGEFLWVKLAIGCSRNQDGSIKYVIAFMEDISERKRIRQELEDNLVFLQILLEAIPCPIIYKDMEGKYLGCNRTFESYTGFTREQIIGKTVHELFPKDLADIYLQKDQELYSHPSIQIYENFFEHHDGTRRNILFSKSTFEDSNGNLLGMIVVMMDITETREAEKALAAGEKRFRDLAELLPDGIFECDVDAKFTYTNAAFKSVHGLDQGDDVIGLDALELVHSDEGHRALESIRRLINGRAVNLEEFARLSSPNGEKHTLLVRAIPIFGDGRVVGMRGIVTDITPLKESERERDLLKEQLFQAQKLASLGTLAGGIAHDFNNMLQVIIGYGELLMDDIEKGQATCKDVKTILQTAETAAEIVSKLMALGQQSMVEPRLIDLNDKIRDMESLILHLPHIDQLSLDLVNEPAIIKQNPQQLGQIIMILATNASEAMPYGGHLSFSSSKVDLDEAFAKAHYGVKPGRYVLLTVTDNGRGIDEAILPRIFEPFFSTKERCDIKGMGLGLSVLRGIVQQRGGFVTCESELGKGTTFRVYFPEPTGPAEPHMVEIGPSFSMSRSILIVEDDELVAGLEETAFNQAGYKTIVASSGRQAVNIYQDKHHEIGLVILDLIMPEMNGHECLMELMKINPLVKALVLSGHDPKSEIALAVKPYVVGFLHKPSRMNQLVEVAEVAMKG